MPWVTNLEKVKDCLLRDIFSAYRDRHSILGPQCTVDDGEILAQITIEVVRRYFSAVGYKIDGDEVLAKTAVAYVDNWPDNLGVVEDKIRHALSWLLSEWTQEDRDRDQAHPRR